MRYGRELTEYTAFELGCLLDAIASRLTDLHQYEGDYSKEIEALRQWSTKIIEAKAEVIVQERIVNN